MQRFAHKESKATSPVDLVHRIRGGDPQAEANLVSQYQRPLLEMLRHRSRDPELAQDLLQDTFTIIIKRLRSDGIEDPSKLIAFMHRTAHNLLVGHFRKEARRATQPNTELVETQQNPQGGQLEGLLVEEEGQLVHKLLQELRTSRDREVLLRFYVWEHEKPLICQEMGLSAGQFDRVVSRARQRFRSLVEQASGDQK